MLTPPSVHRHEYEVIVIGGGPAGSGVAGLLASWGHHVLLIDRPPAHARGLAVSIPPSARRALEALGMLTAVDEARFQPWRGNTVWWAERESRVEQFAADEEGYHVVREDLSDVLRPVAVRSGAVLRVGYVRDVRLPNSPAPPADSAAIVVVHSDDGQEWQASGQFVLDCSGRSGAIARHGLRVTEPSHRTVALVGKWEAHSEWAVADDTHTLVAAYGDGWAWSIPTAPAIRYFTVMVDPERTELARGEPSVVVYRSELAKVDALRPLLKRGTLVAGPWGHDATLYSARQYAGPGFLLVGDAASFIDPLSSFGVKKALASAWVSAVVTHTSLVRSEMRGEALEFHERRERLIYASYRAQAARFAATTHEAQHPFWAARASAAEEIESDSDLDAAVLARDPQVINAFADLRHRSEIRLRAGPALSITKRPMIRGQEIVLGDHLTLPDCPDGIRYLRGLDLIELVQSAPQYNDVGHLYACVAQRQPSVELPDFLGALSWLIARHVLEHKSD